MKHLILIVISFLILNLITNAKAASNLKVEGTCEGKLRDGTPVSLTYYSDFDGCKNKNHGAILFTTGREGLLTGTRSFKNDKDIYVIGSESLTLNNSTGETTAKLRYRNDHNALRTVTLQCEVRDYEYLEC